MALPHAGDYLKELEHLAMEALLPEAAITIQAVASGNWSNPAVWDKGRLPRLGDHCCIPAGFKVDVDAVFNDPPATLCVDGGAWLNFLPDRNTGLSVATTCICTDAVTGAVGKLTIGDKGASIQPGFTATWTIADRGIRDDAMRAYDPLDMSGCLMSHGAMRLFGSFKTPYISLASASGTTITLASTPTGWNVGDFILFPPMRGWNEDEVRQIVAISGNVVTIDTALQHDHTGLMDVCNLTRNVTITSAVKDDLTRRGHVMQMHRSDCLVDSVLFKDLGRTNALVPHTLPQLTSFDPTTGTLGTLIAGTDLNTMGRYGGLHAHIRSGAKWTDNPIVVSNSVVWGSPKHGHNNHGGYMYRFGNVLYKCNGSGQFAENGSEIGADRRNVAVSCVGTQYSVGVDNLIFSPTSTPTPPYNYYIPQDLGNQGFGFWVTPGIEFTDNYAYGCFQPAFAWPNRQSYDMAFDPNNPNRSFESWFLFANLNPPAGLVGPDGNTFERPPQTGYKFWPGEAEMLQAGIAVDQTKVQVRTVQTYHARNTFIANIEGFGTYNLGGVPAIFKDMEVIGSSSGWHQQYSSMLQAENVTLRGADLSHGFTNLAPGSGIYGNQASGNSKFTGRTIEGFQAGFWMSGNGNWEFDSCSFNNAIDLQCLQQGPTTLILNNCTFGTLPAGMTKKANVALDGTVPGGGDINVYFLPCRVIIDGKDAIGDYQMPDYVPFPTNPRPWDSSFNPAWVGLTNKQLHAQFGVWPGGYVIPDQAFISDPRVVGGKMGIVGPAVGPVVPPVTVAVPDVQDAFNAAIQAAATQAAATLAAAGLTSSVKAPVVSQSPAAGTQAPKGSTVTIQ